MSKFNSKRGNYSASPQGPGEPVGPMTFPDLIEYEVRLPLIDPDTGAYVRETIWGHMADTPEGGGLNIRRYVFVAPNQPMVSVVKYYAPGQWVAIRTDYEGYVPVAEEASSLLVP